MVFLNIALCKGMTCSEYNRKKLIKKQHSRLHFDVFSLHFTDSTAAMTGIHRGAIRYIEVNLGRAEFWKICMFHMIELPPRKLFERLDGKSDGPQGPGGPLGHALRSLNNNLKPSVNFDTIESDVPDDIDEKLFNGKQDLKLLLVYVRAVATGEIEEKYLTTILPEMNVVRWRTTFIRFLRLYIQTENPPPELIIMVHFIQKSYAPICFEIVLHPYIEYGTYHFFNYLKLAKASSSRETWEIISKHFAPVNSYWSHPENLLFCGIGKENKHVFSDHQMVLR